MTVRFAKIGWTDQDAIWHVDLGRPREPCNRWQSRCPSEKGHFWTKLHLSFSHVSEQHSQWLLTSGFCTHDVEQHFSLVHRLLMQSDATINFSRWKICPHPAVHPFVRILWPLVLFAVGILYIKNAIVRKNWSSFVCDCCSMWWREMLIRCFHNSSACTESH